MPSYNKSKRRNTLRRRFGGSSPNVVMEEPDVEMEEIEEIDNVPGTPYAPVPVNAVNQPNNQGIPFALELPALPQEGRQNARNNEGSLGGRRRRHRSRRHHSRRHRSRRHKK